MHAAISAAAADAPSTFIAELELLVFGFMDVFRVRLGPDPPVDIQPAIIKLRPDAAPTLCKPRNMPPLYRDFLSRALRST